jgi:peptidoglycan/LPS O-acetylase OafA/YrhL
MVFGSLTAMRGVAALLVAFFHLRYGVIGVPLFGLYIFTFRFGNRGYLWVDFFFILSGFILAYRYGDACKKLDLRGYRHFVWQRIARIWPLNVVTVLIAILYLGSKYGANYLRRDAIIANLLLVHGWGHYFPPPLDFPSWSLSCEWGAYLVLPFYLWAIWPVKRGTSHLLFIAGYLGLLFWYSAHFGNGTLDRLRERWGLGRCLIEVAIGVSLFQLNSLYRSRKIHHDNHATLRMAHMYDAIAAVTFCAIFVVFAYTSYDFYFVPLAAGLILCLSLAQGPFTRVLEWRPMALLGEISFSIYMLHGFVLWLCQDIPTSFKARLPVLDWGTLASRCSPVSDRTFLSEL